MEFAGQTVLVTGGGTGLGLAIARTMARRGARIALNDISPDRLDRARRDLESKGVNVFTVAADVRDQHAVNDMVASVVEHNGSIDMLVANAGVYPVSRFLDMPEHEWDNVLDTNLKGTFLTCQAVARHMIQAVTRGRIITISSGAANAAITGWAHYCTSKAGVVMLTRAMALELASHGIRVNSILPGYIDVEDGGRHLSERYKAEARAGIPLGRPGTPEDVANAVALVASERAGFITGAAIPVDGGSSSGRNIRLPTE
jgi:3-oxoacyl-[acyl-carrier protein] reductase